MDALSAQSLLGWWQDAGVDMFVDEAPRNWLAEPRAPAVASAEIPQSAPAPVTPRTMPAFRAWLEEAEALPDGSPKGRRIFPSGDVSSALMVLVDMPEPGDSDAGALLSDDAGRLFDRMLAAIGRSRDSIWLASLTLTRPAGGGIDAQCAEAIGAFAKHHVALVRPRRLLLMGQAASRAVLGMDLVAARGSLHAVNHDGVNMEAVATFAPRFLLRNPQRKADSWRDLRLLIEGIE
ncbi:uracil-DNA glycosylase family protein [Sphingomonas cavernae]|uniref:Uracil-DNA glycosylase n=1 Tax=Sphingomonas cavernae TaxID=2320861 RepID=A0A418W808_9SPHN|nr:uracil-DNA glycosylase family protein [Sphingomonas cavernae]RJF86141.1 uracil-DNA glycosylase [Sphingomonas cavernae]